MLLLYIITIIIIINTSVYTSATTYVYTFFKYM